MIASGPSTRPGNIERGQLVKVRSYDLFHPQHDRGVAPNYQYRRYW